MNKHFTLLFCFLSINCDGFNDPESPYEEKYVVFGNISANQPMINDTIFVSRTASLDEMVDAENLWVSDAEVTIFNDNMIAKASPVIGSAGRYQTDPSVVFMSGVKYHLEVNVNGKILTSETTTPNTIEISADSELKTYTCNDGTTLPISIINVDNVDENGGPILGKVDTLLYNYGQCFTGSFASYPLFMLDFVVDDSSKLVRTVTYAMEADVMGLEPLDDDGNFIDYNSNKKRDSTYINLIYDTTFVHLLWKEPYLRDNENNPYRENPFVWPVERTPVRMSWLFFNYYGLQRITVSATDPNYYNYLKGDPLGNNIYSLPGSNINGGYGLFSSNTSKTFFVYLKRGKDYN